MPIPSRAWFPQALAERAAWLNNFITNIIPLAPQLGITPAEVTELQQDVEDYRSVATTTLAAEAFLASLREYRISLSERRTGEPQPVFPTANFTAPPNNRPAGLFQRLIELVDRIRAAPAYTDEVGALLDIIPRTQSSIAEEELKPVIKASESFGGYTFTLHITRLGMPQFKIQMQRTTTSPWEDVAYGTSNPIEVTVTPTTPGEPERVLIRALLMQKNKVVGQPSDLIYVTINP